MHSTSSSEIAPSAVTSLCPMPSFLQACSHSSSPPRQQATDVGADLHVVLAQRLACAASSSSRPPRPPAAASSPSRRAISCDQFLGDGADFVLRSTAASGSAPTAAGPADSCCISLRIRCSSCGEKVM